MGYWVSSLYGVALCSLAGVSGAVAAVFGKLAGLEHLELPVQITCYVLLLVVSRAHRRNCRIITDGEGTMVAQYLPVRIIILHTSLAAVQRPDARPVRAGPALHQLAGSHRRNNRWVVAACLPL